MPALHTPFLVCAGVGLLSLELLEEAGVRRGIGAPVYMQTGGRSAPPSTVCLS